MTDYAGLTDEELVVLLREDKLHAFKEIYKRYWKRMFGAAYKRLKSKEQAEEIVQELFTVLWVKRQTLNIAAGLQAYLFASVSHTVIDYYRKELVRQKYREAFKLVHHNETDNSTEETILLKDLTETIESEISLLPDKCRSVFELSRKEHKSNKEIALYLGISEKTVENHLTKAIKRLQLGLSHYLGLMVFLLFR